MVRSPIGNGGALSGGLFEKVVLDKTREAVGVIANDMSTLNFLLFKVLGSKFSISALLFSKKLKIS